MKCPTIAILRHVELVVVGVENWESLPFVAIAWEARNAVRVVVKSVESSSVITHVSNRPVGHKFQHPCNLYRKY